MISKVKILWIMIALLVGVIVILQMCQPEARTIDNTKPNDTIRTETVKTITIDYTLPAPKPIIIHDSFPVNQKIDTAAIVAEYHKVNEYDIPVQNDSVAKLNFTGKVYRNKLYDVALKGSIYEHTTTNYVTSYIPTPLHNKVFVGPAISYGIDFAGIAAAVMLLTKQDHGYSLSYDPFNKVYQAALWFKIKIRK